ncbi:divergent protein kinase domain 2B isoform X1 [Homo sapiens]|uniref:divergent protein kinase domain 2B isoform X1 n=1 Tax=Homo sapiens TaxID=9606 RepID=UPI0001662D7A|nr:divergent protein kinase domain 2B isoform X1 [Homo sapiens]XP_054183845.1 divergent protein kinase domain 2B isoform X1 [Homo sapiens]|eukprot:XP_005272727.1 deleted in autism-related protein 1 isoform X1 [Homo sapiens]
MEPQLGPEAAALRPGWLALLLWVSALSCSFSLPASSLSSLVPQVRTSYNFGRTFLGLDKCNACIGTSICKKFFKEEIRSDNWLASHLGLPPDSLLSYPANYSDDSKIWRPVEIFRLVSKYQNEISDRRICASASAPKTCSIERVLRKTERFQKWLQAKRLTPDLVQIFPGAEGWPLPKYLGSCGRFLVSTSTRPLQEFYDAPPDQAADLAYQLLGVLESLRSNDLNYFFYFTHIDAGMFGVFNNGHLFIRDASAVGVIDKQEGSQEANRAGENKDIFSCLVSGCQAQLPSCESISEKQSLVLVCQKLLPRLLQGRFPSPVQDDIDSILVQCGDSIRPDPEVLGAASQLKDILRPLRTCDSRFAYRYPDCKYNDKF